MTNGKKFTLEQLNPRSVSAGVLEGLVQAEGVAVVFFQLAKSEGGKDGPAAQHQKGQMGAVDHLRRGRVKTVRHEQGGEQRGDGDAKADGHRDVVSYKSWGAGALLLTVMTSNDQRNTNKNQSSFFDRDSGGGRSRTRTRTRTKGRQPSNPIVSHQIPRFLNQIKL